MTDINELAATVRRWTDDPCAEAMSEHAQGEWVLYDDYETALDALVAECESEAELHRIELHHANAKRSDAEARARRYEELESAAMRLCNVLSWSYGGPETLRALADKIAKDKDDLGD